VAGELDELLVDVTTPADRAALYPRIAANVRSRPGAPNPITRADLLAAFVSFWLVVIASVPAAIPFLVIDEAYLALRISNAIVLALLFVTGYWWARFTLGKPWVVGFCFLAGGTVLVLAAIALGG
jgi:VIT1/CCC1 family predicted Fe2+/Mn2+ transporter